MRGDALPPKPLPNMPVGGCSSPRIWPKVPLESPGSGNPKFGWLRTLKNWKPIPSEAPSHRGSLVFFISVKSALK